MYGDLEFGPPDLCRRSYSGLVTHLDSDHISQAARPWMGGTRPPVWPALHTSMEKAMAPHSSTLAWKIPWTEEPGGLQSMGSLGVGHDWATSLSLFTFMHWRRKWQPTPVFVLGGSQGRINLHPINTWGAIWSNLYVVQHIKEQQCLLALWRKLKF